MYPGAASASASIASWRTFDGPDPNRPSDGRRSAGRVMGGVVGASVTGPRLVSKTAPNPHGRLPGLTPSGKRKPRTG